MKIYPVSNWRNLIQGCFPLPMGAVVLAEQRASGPALICLLPSGLWVRWSGGAISNMDPVATQKLAMAVIVGQLGGTAATVAEKLDVSPRTVEAWRSGKLPLNVKSAYAIAEKITEAQKC